MAIQIKKVWEKDKESEAITAQIKFMRHVTNGTKKMRLVAKEEDYLPQFPNESDSSYKTRLAISVLKPFTADAVQSAKGKIFAKEMKLVDLPSEFEKYDIINNFDRNGASIHEFAAELCETQIKEGIPFVFTAFPGTKEINSTIMVPSKQLRPYAVMVTGDSIISKKYVSVNGKKVLQQVVISESVNENDGDYHQAKVVQYRKVFINNVKQIQYIVYRKGASGEEIVGESGTIQIAGQKEPQIPLEPCYGVKKSYFNGVSPFEDLGDLNIQHYQQSSDFKMTWHRAGASTPVIIGDKKSSIPGKDDTNTQTGGDEIMHLEKDGKFEWVSGSAELNPMKEDIREEEEYMKGIAFTVVDNGDKTATQIRDEKSDKEAKLKNLAKNLENCLNKTILHMCEYLNIDLGDGKVVVNKDFNLTVMPIEDMKLYVDMVNFGLMTKETFYKEAQAGERLLTVEDAETEIDLLTDGTDDING